MATGFGLRPRYAQPCGTARPDVLECVIAYNALGAYCLPTPSIHRPAAQRVMAGEVWEPKTIQLVCRNLGAGDAIHAGTYFGDFLPAFSRACAPGAVVWAFEPNSENFRCAEITLKINGLTNVTLANAALASGPGVGTVLTTDAHGRAKGGASRVVNATDASAGSGVQPVALVTVDDVVPDDRNVSVIQLDVEGNEQAVLSGAVRTIARCRPLLVLETGPDDAWSAAHLHPLGYRSLGKVHRNVVLACTGSGELFR